MTIKHLLAALRLPLAAQTALARDPDPLIREALGASWHTDQRILTNLAVDPRPAVRRHAHLHIDDVDLLAKALHGKRAGLSTPYAARNPNAPTELLVKALKSPNRTVALAAHLNPVTPLEARRTLTVERAEEITSVGGSNHDHVVRANELAVNNPWMLETAGAWDGNVRRALAGLHQASVEQLEEIANAGRAGHSILREHPLRNSEHPYNGEPLERWDTARLAGFASTATDLLALEREDLNPDLGRSLIRPRTEPHIIGRVVDRFGIEILDHRTVAVQVSWSSTRWTAAIWACPILGYVASQRRGTPPRMTLIDAAFRWDALRETVDMLGENQHAWETFLSLTANDAWHEPLTAAAAAALEL